MVVWCATSVRTHTQRYQDRVQTASTAQVMPYMDKIRNLSGGSDDTCHTAWHHAGTAWG
jgi:hypothetical protein